MRTCPECGAAFEGNGSFCPNCGKYMPFNKEAVQTSPEICYSSEPAPDYNNPEQPEPQMNVPQQGFCQVPNDFESFVTPSVGSCLLSIFLCSIPLVGLIYVICLAFGATKYAAKKNFARALFLWTFICLVVECGILLAVMFFFPDLLNFSFFENIINSLY